MISDRDIQLKILDFGPNNSILKKKLFTKTLDFKQNALLKSNTLVSDHSASFWWKIAKKQNEILTRNFRADEFRVPRDFF